ncbi:MAG: FAD-dependent oxidoreductase [Pseudobacteriovorax sp.]|nr:FAD-dependent oxidoreductase [Pseudobacteriovorax sp.]
MDRKQRIKRIESTDFDVLIIGGGISGSSCFQELSTRGFRTLLIDRSDFASGTSQASSMMIWGGLLYLKQFDIKSVWKLSKARDHLIKHAKSSVIARDIYFIGDSDSKVPTLFMYVAVLFYWIMSRLKRDIPKITGQCPSKSLLTEGQHKKRFLKFQEGFLSTSDASHVNEKIHNNQNTSIAINYCEFISHKTLETGHVVKIRDRQSNKILEIPCKLIVNAAGVWADAINDLAKVQTPYKHALSKGVSINFKRAKEHQNPIVVEMGENGDTLCFLPFGPTSTWGPTETYLNSINEGFSATKTDIDWLLQKYNQHFSEKKSRRDIVSIRVGIRPLAVKKGKKLPQSSLAISRKHIIYAQKDQPWITIYGGKITGSREGALRVVKHAKKLIRQAQEKPVPPPFKTEETAPTDHILGFTVIHPQWARDQTQCLELEDYLRRRTNLAQWVPNGAFGENFEHEGVLYRIALTLKHNNQTEAKASVDDYKSTITMRMKG